jgi:hypothetical protein
VAQKVGRSREYVSNSIRLLALPEHVLDALKRGEITEGHARTLLMLSDRPEEQAVIFKEITLKKLSVRETERIIRKIATDKVRKKTPGEFDAHLIEFEKQFTEALGTRVQILKTEFGGKLTIDYFSDDDLETLLTRMAADAAKQQSLNAPQHAIESMASATPLQTVSAPPTPHEMSTEAAAAPEVADPAHSPPEHEIFAHHELVSHDILEQPLTHSPEDSPTTETTQPPAPPSSAASTRVDDADNLYSIRNFTL